MIQKLMPALLFALSQSVLAQPIADFSAHYLVQYNGIQAGELTRTLITNENGDRIFTSTTKPTGIAALFKPDVITEISIWRDDNQTIKPQSYRYKRTGGKKEKHVSAQFDWQAMQINVNDNGRRSTLTIAQSIFDKLVYQLAIMADLSAGKKTLNYRIVDDDRLKNYVINIKDKEIITTPLGDMPSIKLMRERTSTKGRQTTLWCAPELGFLPVKLEHIEKDGSVFTALLKAYE